MTPEQVMKKCQIGYGGRNASEQCHSLLAECYGTIGRMLQWIEDEGERTDTCTKPVTGKVCRGCRCIHAPSNDQLNATGGSRVAVEAPVGSKEE